MRKTLPALLVLGTSSIALSPALASWDPWPCEVVLCMANPAGPTAAAACVPPIQRLWREMSRPVSVCRHVSNRVTLTLTEWSAIFTTSSRPIPTPQPPTFRQA